MYYGHTIPSEEAVPRGSGAYHHYWGWFGLIERMKWPHLGDLVGELLSLHYDLTVSSVHRCQDSQFTYIWENVFSWSIRVLIFSMNSVC